MNHEAIRRVYSQVVTIDDDLGAFDADGNQVWFEEVTETERKMVATFSQPLAEGTWTLNVDARGYGEEVANLYKDSFQVLIKIERKCWEYPNEIGCAYD